MAHRKHVNGGTQNIVALMALATFLSTGCSEAGAQATEFRGRVIDQDTGQPIAGAIVVGKYMGSRGAEGASSCNRVESAVSDQDGWFTMPIDSRDSPPFMEAYHRDYRWGMSTRWAQRAADGNMNHWQVQIVEWNAAVNRGRPVRNEPTIYYSEREAKAASREQFDVYLKRFSGTREQRLDALHVLTNAGSCVAPHRTTAGPVPFFEAIYQEQTALGDDKRSLQMNREVIEEAESSFAHSRRTK